VKAGWLVVLAACFHAHGSVKDAESATYKMTGAAMMSLAEDVAKQTYKLADIDNKKLELVTAKQTYDANGKTGSAAGSGTQYEVQMVVDVLELAGGDCSVQVKTKTFEGGKQLDAEDPSIPDFVHARANDLSIAIYDRAKAFAYSH
jgi:hypothetical protein